MTEDRNAECWTEDGAGVDPDDPEPFQPELGRLIGHVIEHCVGAPDSRPSIKP